MESWYRKVTQRTKSPELRLGEISMLLVSGRTEKNCTFGQRNCAELNHVGKNPGRKIVRGYCGTKQHKTKFGYPDDKAGEIDPTAVNMEPVGGV